MQAANELLKMWKRHIIAGNESFDMQQTLATLAHYREAIALAEDLFDVHEDARAAAAALIVSYHNLANVYLREHEFTMAEAELQNVHHKVSLALTQATPNSTKSEALLWAVSRTYFALLTHKKNHPNRVISAPPPTSDLFENNVKNTPN